MMVDNYWEISEGFQLLEHLQQMDICGTEGASSRQEVKQGHDGVRGEREGDGRVVLRQQKSPQHGAVGGQQELASYHLQGSSIYSQMYKSITCSPSDEIIKVSPMQEVTAAWSLFTRDDLRLITS